MLMLEEDLSVQKFEQLIVTLDEDAQSHPNRTYYFRREGDLNIEDTIDSCTRTIQSDPQNIKAFQLRGNLLFRKNEHRQALLDFTKVLDIDPINVECLYNRGISSSKLGQHGESIIDFTSVLKLCPEHFNAAFGRAASYNVLGLFSSAIEDYNFALSREEVLFQLDERTSIRRRRRMLGIRDNEIDDGSNSPARSPVSFSPVSAPCDVSDYDIPNSPYCLSPCPPDSIIKLGFGNKLHNNGSEDFDNQGLSINEKDSSLNSKMSISDVSISRKEEIMMFTEKDIENALLVSTAATAANMKTNLERSNEIQSGDIDGGELEGERGDVGVSEALRLERKADDYHAHGYLMRREGKYEEAIVEYSKALEHCPSHFKALFNRAFAYDRMGSIKKAVDDYTAALRVEPENAFAYYNRGISNDRLGKLEEAVKDFSQAIFFQKDCPDFYHNRAFSYEKLGKSKESVSDYGICLQLRPKHVKTLYSRAHCYESCNNYVGALEDYTSLLLIQPGHINSLVSRATIYDRFGQNAEALVDISKALGKFKSLDSRGTAIRLLDGDKDCKNGLNSQLSSSLSLSSSVVDKEQERNLDRLGNKEKREKRKGKQARNVVTLVSLLSFRAKLYSKGQPEEVELAVLDLSEALLLYASPSPPPPPPPPQGGDSSCKSPVSSSGMSSINTNCITLQENNEIQRQNNNREKESRACLLFSRGLCHKSLQYYQAAISDFTEALSLESENFEMFGNYDNEDLNKGVGVGVRVRVGVGDVSSPVGYIRGHNYNYSSCRGSLSSETDDEERDHRTYAQLIAAQASTLAHRGYCFRKLNNFESSVLDYSQVILMTPGNIQVRTQKRADDEVTFIACF
jgi:tetratricopeptide (TPR) repeat protein